MGDAGMEPTPRAYWARRAVREKLYQEIKAVQVKKARVEADDGQSFSTFATEALPSLGPIFDVTPLSPFNLPTDDAVPDPNAPEAQVPFDFHSYPDSQFPDVHRICIIGAGVTGLYIAMILDDLKIPNLTYEILEGSDRIGGRMYTHYFSRTSKKTHDYYDIGAMRFPYLAIMKRTFDLFTRLKIPMIPYYLNHESTKPPAKGSVNCATMYNDITVIDGEKPGPDPFQVSTLNDKGSVPADKVDKVNDLLETAFGPYKKVMAENFDKGFEMLKRVDEYSTREYLKNPPAQVDPKAEKLDFFTIQWLETNNTSSGLFDQAFSESVIDSFDFDSPEKDDVEKWYCIEGGTSLVTEAMVETISQPVQKNQRVNKITWDRETNELAVHVVDEPKARDPYTTVFNTTSLGCLQRMDLTSLDLHPSQKDAIRCLHYDDSAKVAIKFSYPWWIVDCGITCGGISSTDIPIRTCVYPSYNMHDGSKEPAILLCSYTWSQDATRIGSLVNSKSPDNESELKALMLDNLARLHFKNYSQNKTFDPPLTLQQIRTRIADAYLTHHAFSWSHDPYTSGAFALFGPGQFQNLYPYLSRPAANSRFHIAGEASSAHHAWVVGSLDSAVASVQRFLRRFLMWEKLEELREKYGVVEEVEGGKDGTLHLQVLLGQVPAELQVQV